MRRGRGREILEQAPPSVTTTRQILSELKEIKDRLDVLEAAILLDGEFDRIVEREREKARKEARAEARLLG